MFFLRGQATINTFPYLVFSSKTISILLLSIGFIGSQITAADAQSVIKADDGVGTKVQQNQNVIGIDGGTQSGNNLFHSFERFGLSEGETAIFLSDPKINNILGRVVGNEASVINGLLQVNNNTNLFLMNPAGIIFGNNAQLNVGGDFTATTATGIGFGDGSFFNVYGDNDFSTLTGTPFQFAFDSLSPNATPGAIVNTGNLVSTGDINLIGGSVASTGTISSTKGNITISAVPNSSLLTIEQQGNLLSLEIDPPRDENGDIVPFDAVDLPELLTGNILVNQVSGENVTIDANEGKLFVGTDRTFEPSSSLPAIDVFDGDISASSQVSLAGSKVLITEASAVNAESILQPSDSEIDSSNNESNPNVRATNDLVEGIDLDGDGIPDVPIGIVPETPETPETRVDISDEVISQVNSDVLNSSDSTTVENLQQLENTTITYQPPQAQDPQAILERQVKTLEENFSNDYKDYYAYSQPGSTLGEGSEQSATENTTAVPDSIFADSEDEQEVSLAQIQQVLKKIETATGAKPAVIYAAFYPSAITSNQSEQSILPQPDDELELVVVTADAEPVRRRIEGADRTQVQQIANRFTDSIFYELPESEYLPPSQQLYQWLVEPLANVLET